jgi:hypothetical protein
MGAENVYKEIREFRRGKTSLLFEFLLDLIDLLVQIEFLSVPSSLRLA